MVHAWTPPEAVAQAAGGRSNPLAVKGVPGETFSFTLLIDVVDMIADGSPVAQSVAYVSGIYTRLAALEMLQYPVAGGKGDLVGSVSAGAGGLSLGGSARAAVNRSIPASQVPTVLFVWGPGRIVPVRVTGLSITEMLYDALLNPTHAQAQVNLRVLTPEELLYVTGPLKDIARGAYKYSQGLRQALAIANLANAVEDIIGMLPI